MSFANDGLKLFLAVKAKPSLMSCSVCSASILLCV